MLLPLKENAGWKVPGTLGMIDAAVKGLFYIHTIERNKRVEQP